MTLSVASAKIYISGQTYYQISKTTLIPPVTFHHIRTSQPYFSNSAWRNAGIPFHYDDVVYRCSQAAIVVSVTSISTSTCYSPTRGPVNIVFASFERAYIHMLGGNEVSTYQKSQLYHLILSSHNPESYEIL
jgi:hypothetical protein